MNFFAIYFNSKIKMTRLPMKRIKKISYCSMNLINKISQSKFGTTLVHSKNFIADLFIAHFS